MSFGLRLSNDLSIDNPMSGKPSRLHCFILASKWLENNVNGFVGWLAKDVRARQGS